MTPKIHELAFRAADGLAISLLWREPEQLSVLVVDERNGALVEVPVPAGKALDAFHHPYTYARRAA